MSVHWAKADIRLRASGSDFDPRARPVKAHGGGWSNLWRLSAPDRWFVRNIFELNPKSHRDGVHARFVYVFFGGTADIAFQARHVCS